MNLAIGVDINIKHIEVAIINLNTKSIVEGTSVYREVDCNGTADYLIAEWSNAVKQSQSKCPLVVKRLGLCIPGPFDYEKGISLMHNQQKFDAIYQLNVKELLAKSLEITIENIKMDNNTSGFLLGEVMAGAGRGFKNILGYTLDNGFGTARYGNGLVEDLKLWDAPFKNGIAEDYFDIKWIASKYRDYLDVKVDSLKHITELTKTDGGIGWLVFNEYGENFASFLVHYIKMYWPELIIIGGNSDAWELFIPHVKDRLYDKKLELPIRKSQLGDKATVMGAAYMWAD